MNSNLDTYISDGTPERVRERYRRLSDLAKKMDFGALDENIVVIDTETTGFSFNHDELTQIAAARMEHGEVVDWYVTFVNPGKPIPDDVAHLTNIHDEDVADAPPRMRHSRGLSSSRAMQRWLPTMLSSTARSRLAIRAVIRFWITFGSTRSI